VSTKEASTPHPTPPQRHHHIEPPVADAGGHQPPPVDPQAHTRASVSLPFFPWAMDFSMEDDGCFLRWEQFHVQKNGTIYSFSKNLKKNESSVSGFVEKKIKQGTNNRIFGKSVRGFMADSWT